MMRIHFIGAGGSGISGVAKLAAIKGYEVSGCDLQESSAYDVHLVKGHSPDHLKDADLAVTSPALFYSPENEEIDQARKQGILITWQRFVGEYLAKNKKVICIAGTHGKSTTTAMVGKILVDVGMDPTVVIGASVPEWGGNYRAGAGEYLIIEADEFNDNFLNYKPDAILLNNIEFDHPDYFKDLETVKKSFDKFIGKLKKGGVLVTQKDNLHKKFNLKVGGSHNQDNANMAYSLALKLGIDKDQIIRSIENFSGIGRRMELICFRGGIRVYDDYAHHPTAIKTTLKGLREQFPNSKIIVFNEPHGYLRTKALLNDYKDVFDAADKVYIGPIFAARDKVDKTITPQLVAQKSGHKNVYAFASIDEILENFGMDFKPGDIILVMGAGESYKWAKKIASKLPVDFRDLTTLKVGGRIKKYVEINDEAEIPATVTAIKAVTKNIFVLGEGSDILVSDGNYDGAVLKYLPSNIKVKGDLLISDAGANWDEVVKVSIEQGLQGIECLSGIPGTAGAAPIQNIGAYGQEIKNTFVSLKAYDMDKEDFTEFTASMCDFGYRESIFKRPSHWQKYIITQVTLKLSSAKNAYVAYESLATYLNQKGINKPTLNDVRTAVLKIRSGKFEDPKIVGNAGSFFKNPIISKTDFKELVIKFPDIKYFETNQGYKIFAGWLIEAAGWKGKKYKSAAVSSNHALILINPDGNAKARDIYELSELIINEVNSKFGIKLEREVQLINF